MRIVYSTSRIEKLRCREGKQYTQASCTNWKPFIYSGVLETENSLVPSPKCFPCGTLFFSFFNYYFIFYFPRCTLGNLSKHTSDPLSHSILRTPHSAKILHGFLLLPAWNKTKQCLNMTYTTGPFRQCLPYIVPLSVSQPYQPLSGFRILASSATLQGFRMCISVWISLSTLFTPWSIHSNP